MGIHMLHRRTAMATAIVSALLAPVPAVAARASTAQVPPACRSTRNPELAARMSRDIRAVLSSRQGTVAMAVRDDHSDLTCALASERRYDSASVVKVTIMEATLQRADELQRSLTEWERANVQPMIMTSDNTAAQHLWNDLGRTYLGRFLDRVGTRRTELGPAGYWGLTRTTAADQMRLLGVLSNAGSFLKSRAYGLKLLNQVREDQRWGVPAGMPRKLQAHIKNGWLPRSTHGWRVHSVGVFTGSDRTYRIVVLSHDNPTMAYGVRTIERIAQVVHRGLNRGRGAVQGLTPENRISEVSDGSAPRGPVPGWDEPERGATP
ncbi:serine hydrolase [Streptomyces mirabilis]|uniref:serine hydrolase n=1 Tax=Streptomyces mirabilis TaxID=68239 RepID=UPI000765A1C8|nr:serine hydrolase [Streptomyces mirabilis]